MDLTEMRGLLMLDIKMTLDTEISTAEATRCIFRAVDDLSRRLPREKMYEHTWVEAVTDNSFVAPAAQSDTSIINALSIKDDVDGATLSVANLFPDIPRPLKVTLTDANNSISRMTLVIKGIDGDGIYREERFYRQDGKVQTGKVHFSMVSQVQLSEIAGNGDGDTISIGYGIITGIWIQLANPIKPGSISIYSDTSKGGTKFTLDTDYEVDYANGKVNLKPGGSMTAGTTYYTNYNKSDKAIDISAIIPELVRIIKVIYPVNKIPEQSVAFSIWENMMTIGSPKPGTSQEPLVNGNHIAIYYETRQGPPTEAGSGSYPENLDQVVLIGAGAYAFLMKAVQIEGEAVDDLESARAAIVKVTGSGVHGLISAALGTAGAKAALAGTALGKVATYLETYDVGDSSVDNARTLLARITDDTSTLRERIDSILSKANTYIFGDTEPSALKYLDTGDAKIDVLTDGERVAEKYADYSRASAQLFQSLVAEASVRIANLRTYIEESGGWNRIADTFIAEASQRVGEAGVYLATTQALLVEMDGYLSESSHNQETVANGMLLADRFRAEGQLRLNEFIAILDSKAEYRRRIVDVPVRQPA